MDELDAALGGLRAAGWPAPEDPGGDDDAELDGRDLICDRLLNEVGWLRQCAGWLTHLRSRAEEMRCFAMFQLGAIGGTDPALPGPDASPLHDALNAVAAAAHAAVTGHGFDSADLWPLLGRFGLARHLAPARAG
jgi:hypothetical protein